MFQVFKISGDSLYPYYKDGQRVLCRKIFTHTKVGINDAIVFQKDSYGKMIKRIKYMKENKYFVEGTDPMSIDSRNFGMLTREEIQYKVVFKF